MTLFRIDAEERQFAAGYTDGAVWRFMLPSAACLPAMVTPEGGGSGAAAVGDTEVVSLASLLGSDPMTVLGQIVAGPSSQPGSTTVSAGGLCPGLTDSQLGLCEC